MNVKIYQSLQLKQMLQLNHVMIQRFMVLQQSVNEFEESLTEQAKKNPFLYVKTASFESVDSYSDSDSVSPLDVATYEETLLSTLMTQLDAQFISELEYDIVLTLIDHLDDHGLLPNYKDIRADIMAQHNVDERYVFHCLKILQSFEPDGIGARSINECLWNQIESYGLTNKTDEMCLKTLVKSYLDAISTHQYGPIMAALGISMETLSNYIQFIGQLQPNPAAPFKSREMTIPVQPSLRVTIDNGTIELHNLEQQRMTVHLNDNLIKQLNNAVDEKAKKQLEEAKIWLAHFQKRQELLMACGHYLIQKQRLYFLEGDAYLLPCLQRDLANQLGVSESTISRLVRTKYIEWNGRVILFKNLCQRGIFGKTKRQVKLLIAYYKNQNPLFSDQKLADILKHIGLPIARRTVTKYRHEIEMNPDEHSNGPIRIPKSDGLNQP